MSRARFAVLALGVACWPAYAGTLLQTSPGAQVALAGLIGKPSGVTVTGPHGTGGACHYTGRGAYALDDAGRLSMQAEENCAGLMNFWTLAVCGLSTDLECAGAGQFPHHYQVLRAGLKVDAQVIPWLATQAPSVPDLLEALKGRVAAAEALARAQRPGAVAAAGGLVVRCHAPRSNFMIRGGLSNLMLYQQRPDPDGVCADKVLQQTLANAQVGDPIGRDSPLGHCFELAGKITNWSTTSCVVATH
jgi:hypothetical protein